MQMFLFFIRKASKALATWPCNPRLVLALGLGLGFLRPRPSLLLLITNYQEMN